MISDAGSTPPQPQQTVTAIDRAIAGDCPCGNPPRPGSVYCGPDCEPTHLAADSDTNDPGQVSYRHGVATPMRWRPDLVTDDEEFEYEPVDAPTHYEGPFFARLLRPRDDNGLHLRLDDGHRWVGFTLDRFTGEFTPAFVDAIRKTWRRLERALTDPAQTIRDDDPHDTRVLLREARRRREGAVWLGMHRWERRCRACGQYGAPVSGLVVPPVVARFADGLRTTDPIPEPAAVECQVCPHCRTPYPGPPLSMTIERTYRPSGWHCRMVTTVDRRRYGYSEYVEEHRVVAAVNPAAYVRRVWDGMEAQLLDAVAFAALPGPSSHGTVAIAPIGTLPDDPDRWRNVGHTSSDGLDAMAYAVDAVSRHRMRGNQP